MLCLSTIKFLMICNLSLGIRIIMLMHAFTIACRKAPAVKWAQRTDVLYVTVSLPSIKSSNVDLKPESLTFS